MHAQIECLGPFSRHISCKWHLHLQLSHSTAPVTRLQSPTSAQTTSLHLEPFMQTAFRPNVSHPPYFQAVSLKHACWSFPFDHLHDKATTYSCGLLQKSRPWHFSTALVSHLQATLPRRQTTCRRHGSRPIQSAKRTPPFHGQLAFTPLSAAKLPRTRVYLLDHIAHSKLAINSLRTNRTGVGSSWAEERAEKKGREKWVGFWQGRTSKIFVGFFGVFFFAADK